MPAKSFFSFSKGYGCSWSSRGFTALNRNNASRAGAHVRHAAGLGKGLGKLAIIPSFTVIAACTGHRSPGDLLRRAVPGREWVSIRANRTIEAG